MDLKILFIEDDDNIRENYVHVLKKDFKDVFEARDGFEAYEKYLQHQPDIMIIDINLPKMSGIEFLKKVRVTDLNTKAILLTSYNDTQTLLEASSLKLIEYLVKPVERKKFQAAIKAAVDEFKNFRIYSSKVLNLSDGFYWNFHEKRLYNLQQIVKLTKTEKDILNIIFHNSLNNLTFAPKLK